MKLFRLFVFLPLLALISAGDRAIVRDRAVIEFTRGGTAIDRLVEAQLDAVYEALPEGHEVELRVVGEREMRNDYVGACELSHQRCASIISYLGALGVGEHNIRVHHYRGRRWMRSVDIRGASGYDGGYIHSVAFTRDPKLPLSFTRTQVDPFENRCYETGLDNSRDRTLYHESGAELFIPAHAFESYSGYDPDCAAIKLRFCHYGRTGDFVRAGLTSNSGKRMLESGGMVYVSATCLGADLRLKEGVEITVALPANGTDDQMRAFIGREQYGIINWNPARTATVSTDRYEEESEWEGDGVFGEGELLALDGYLLRSNNLGWINCDRFYEQEASGELMVKLGSRKKDIAVRMVFDRINAVLPGYYYNNDSLVRFEDIPRGETVRVIAYGKEKDGLFWASQRLTVGETSRIELDAVPVSQAEFDRQIASL